MRNTCSTEGKRNILGQHRVKTFYPIGLNDKGGVLILTQKYLALVFSFFFFCLLLLLGFFSEFWLHRNVILSFLHLFLQFYNLIFPFLYGHLVILILEHFHHHLLKDYWAVFSLIYLFKLYEVRFRYFLFHFAIHLLSCVPLMSRC